LLTATEVYAQRESIGRRSISKSQLSADEIKAIIDAVNVGKLAQREAAAQFGVKPRLVSSLVSEDRNDPAF